MNPDIRTVIDAVAERAKTLVWWSPSQIARGDDRVNDPAQGERPWIVPESTGQLLYDMAITLKPSVILELGTSIGYSTLWLCAAAASFNGHVHSLEMKPEKHQLAQRHLSDAALSQTATLHLGKISDTLPNLHSMIGNEKIGMVFMDADRGHYHEYFPLIADHLTHDAVVIADNAGNMNARMIPFLELLKRSGWSYEILNMDNGILVAKKTP